MRIKTKDCQEVLGVVSKAAGNQAFLPMTCFITLTVSNNQLTMYTTDRLNTLYGTIEVEDAEDFSCSLDCSSFTKLIKGQTSEMLEFSLKEETFHIKGNGRYKLPVMFDGNGNLAIIQDNREFFNGKMINESIKDIYSAINVSAAREDFAVPCYHNIYFGKYCIASDTTKASCYKAAIFDDVLLYNKTVKLLALFNQFSYTVKNHLMVKSGQFELVSSLAMIDEFQVEDILTLFDKTDNETITINKQVLNDCLNRFSVFNETTIYLTFSDTLTVTSEKLDFHEEIDIEKVTYKKMAVDYLMLKQYLKTIRSEEFILELGTNAIKCIDDKIEHVIAVAEI